MLNTSNITPAPAQEIAAQEAIAGAAKQVAEAAYDMSFIGLFMNAGLMVKAVIIILLIYSIWSWAIAFEKYLTLRNIRKKMMHFESDFWAGVAFDRLFKQLKGKEDNPMAMVFTAAIEEMHVGGGLGGIGVGGAQGKSSIPTTERVRHSMQVAYNKSVNNLNKGLSFLGTIGSTAPFIGLFGTVWGIMQVIPAAKGANMAIIAPGIAEALFATALGLITAIPASIFYNKFIGEIDSIASQVEDFMIEMLKVISREL